MAKGSTFFDRPALRRVDNWRDRGAQVLETSIEKGGFKELFHGGNDYDFKKAAAMPGSLMNIQESMLSCAVVLDNMYQYLSRMEETTRSTATGGFQDMIFGMIRSGWPVNPIMELISTQPLTRRIGQVYHMNLKIAEGKGTTYLVGNRVLDSQLGFSGGSRYTEEYVEREQIGVADAATTVDYSTSLTNLEWGGDGGGGVRPNTLTLFGTDKDGSTMWVARDNGNGTVTQIGGNTTVLSSGSIDYVTRKVALTFGAGNGLSAGGIFASYEYEGEGSSKIATLDMDLTSSNVEAKRRAIRIKYTMEAAQDAEAETGLDINQTLSDNVVAYMNAEQARQITSLMWDLAGGATTTFDITHSPSWGMTKREMLTDLLGAIAAASNAIYQDLQYGGANFMIVDTAASTVLEQLGAPHFVGYDKAPPSAAMGVQFIGTWNGNIRVFRDSFLNTYPGASRSGNILLGYKGPDTLKDSGIIYAPYRPFYGTNAYMLEDGVTRRVFASRCGYKATNNKFYRRVALTGA